MTARTRSINKHGNASHAVRAQRKEPPDSFDFFPTPLWATRALCEHVLPAFQRRPLKTMSVWEPACGIGSMAKPLGEYFASVTATDIFDYRDHPQLLHKQDACFDFLMPTQSVHADWIITNPPFRLGVEFIERALALCTSGVAVLVRSQFTEGIDRYNRLFCNESPTVVAHYAERVAMVKGRLDREATTATAYSWFVWSAGDGAASSRRDTRTRWIPPSRKKLEREEDWP